MKTVGQALSTGSYFDQLKDERWIAFAARIKKQRPFCECCRRGNVETQVHHQFYEFSKRMWEYEPDDVSVLCSACHKEIHQELSSFRKHVFKHLNPQAFKTLNGALAVGLTQYDPLVFCHALAEFTGNQRLVENHAKAWGMTAKNQEATMI